jgi:hypothetical protein
LRASGRFSSAGQPAGNAPALDTDVGESPFCAAAQTLVLTAPLAAGAAGRRAAAHSDLG